jgi:hypothetical protein
MNTPKPIKICSAYKRILVLVILFGLWFTFLWNAFGADRSFALYMDNEFFIGTVLSSMSVTLSNGSWPLRMDTIMGGIPLYNFSQLSPFYPFYLTVLPIYSSPLDVVHSMHWIALLHILIMEINMYIFLRVIGTSRIAAITAAALVAFSANSLAYVVWMNIVAPYSWFPLYLAGLIGILKCPRSMAYSAMALAGIVLLTLASPAQPLIHSVFVSLIFVFAYFFSQLHIGESRQGIYTFGRILLIAILSLLLVAPVIIPAALEFKNMIRWIGHFPPVMGNAVIPFEAFQVDQLTITDLAGVFFKLKSAAVGSQFVGVLVIALASVALVSNVRSWIVVSLAFIAVYSLISSTGSNLGLAHLNYAIPMLNKIREPSRFLVLFQFAVSSLAALGIDELRKTVLHTQGRAKEKRQLIALAFTAAVAVMVFFITRERIEFNSPSFVSITILAMLILITWIAAKYNKIWMHSTIVAAVWSILTLTLLYIDVPWIPRPISSSTYLNSGTLALDIAIERIVELDPHHEYRVIFDGTIDKQQAAMLASYQGVRTFNSYFNPAPHRQFLDLYYHGPRADNYFRILGAKYLICSECKAESLHGYSLLEQIAGYEIYVTNDVLPHNYIVQRLNGEFLNLANFVTKAASVDLTKKLLFVEPNVDVGFKGTGGQGVDDCISREDSRTVNHSRFVVQCKSPGVLVMNEFFDDAWKATVDGVKIRSLRVNGNQMGVAFTSGSHVIEFRYLPTIFLVSLGLMFFGVLLVLYLVIQRRFFKVTDKKIYTEY